MESIYFLCRDGPRCHSNGLVAFGTHTGHGALYTFRFYTVSLKQATEFPYWQIPLSTKQTLRLLKRFIKRQVLESLERVMRDIPLHGPELGNRFGSLFNQVV